MKYFIVAGERSGDLHGSKLIAALKSMDKGAEIKCWGGELMEREGADLLMHYRDLAFMGVMEVIKNLNLIRKLFRQCKNDIALFSPDVLILIDYPGFNLRLAKYGSQRGIKVCYYIPPKVWAWNTGRIEKLRNYTHSIYCILPFEVDFYNRFEVTAKYVGNPLVERINDYSYDEQLADKFRNHTCIALLPGSRKQEVQAMIPVMSTLTTSFPKVHFLVSAVSNLAPEWYSIFHNQPNVSIIWDKTYDVLKLSKAAIVTSGTATLETALLNIPQIVCYRTSSLTYQVAKRILKIKYISLVNLIANREVVKELIQDEYNLPNLMEFVTAAINDDQCLEQIKKGYKEIENSIGKLNASKQVAEDIISNKH